MGASNSSHAQAAESGRRRQLILRGEQRLREFETASDALLRMQQRQKRTLAVGTRQRSIIGLEASGIYPKFDSMLVRDALEFHFPELGQPRFRPNPSPTEFLHEQEDRYDCGQKRDQR